LDQPGEKGIQVKRTVLYDHLLKWGPFLAVLAFLSQGLLSTRLSRWVHPESFEAPKVQRVDKKVVSTLRAVAYLSGYKVLVGHAFWIKVIQYYGDASNSLDRYSKLYDYCSLASDLNPRFVPIYTFGAAALAFHVKRVEQAEKLLQKGILSNPADVPLKLMYAAIAYQNTEQYHKVIPFLEAQIMRGDAPVMLINILANTYQKVGRNMDAIRLWKKILRDADTDEKKIEAAQKLQELYAITKGGKF
jgi:tetratricopeptide (TPR) repeat protein